MTGAEVAAAIASVKNLRDLVASLKDSAEKRKMSAAVEDVQERFIDLRGRIMEIQESESAAKERARAAEQELVSLKDWNREAERYELKEIKSGFFAYAIKAGMEQGESTHYLCAGCFENHKKGVLQYSAPVPIAATYTCQLCKTSVHVGR